MKRIVLFIALVLSVLVAYGDVIADFQKAQNMKNNGDYKAALELIDSCIIKLSEEEGDNSILLDSVRTWKKGWQEEQKLLAQMAEREKQSKLRARKENNYVFIYVSDPEASGTRSSITEVLRNHGRSFNDDINEATSFVFVNITTKEVKREDDDYRVDTYGTLRFGDAVSSNQYDLDYSTGQCRGASVESYDDAKNRSLKEMNDKLSEALDCYLSGRQLPNNEKLPNKNIYVQFQSEELESQLTAFRDMVYYYIDADTTYKSVPITNLSFQEALTKFYKTQEKWSDPNERSPVYEVAGCSYRLIVEVGKNVEVGKDNKVYYTFKGTIIESVSNITVKSSKPLSVEVNELSKKYQELAAAMMCESLGIKEWTVGEMLCGGQLLRAPRQDGGKLIPGLICYELDNTYINYVPLHKPNSITNRNLCYLSQLQSFDGEYNTSYWRRPHIEEMDIIAENMDALGMRGLYWTEDVDSKGKAIACEIKNNHSSEKKASRAATIIVRQF